MESTPKSDRELIADIKRGRNDGLAVLFDRNGSVLYEFIFRIVGDREQAARLVEEVFKYTPLALKKLDKPEMVKGWLYAMAREASLAYLRQKDWLNALPLADASTKSGFLAVIERAARAMPASLRAVLIVAELKELSPSEKLRALNVSAAELPRLEEEARRNFNIAFSAQSAKDGQPLASSFEPDRILGLLRRIGPTGSLIGHLPPIILPDSVAAGIRSRLVLPQVRGASPVVPETAEASQVAPPVGEAADSMEVPQILARGTRESKPQKAGRSRVRQWSYRRVGLLLVAILIIGLVAAASGPWAGYFVSRDPTSSVARLIQFKTALGMPTAGCITGIAADEHGEHLTGWTIGLDWTDENKVVRHLSAVTDRNGWFWFPDLKTGVPYAVSEKMQAEWEPVSPVAYAIVLEGCPEVVFKNKLITGSPTPPVSGCITGIVADEHGVHLPGWTIVLDWTDENNATNRLSTTTDKNGWFWFPDLKLGLTYTVSEIMPSGWGPISPTSYTIVLDSCPESIFKNRLVR